MKKNKSKWFIKVRGSYLPKSWQAWLLYLPFTVFLIWVMWFAINSADSFGETVLIIFPQFIAAAVVMTWIASKKS
jgi:hypothetical protein